MTLPQWLIVLGSALCTRFCMDGHHTGWSLQLLKDDAKGVRTKKIVALDKPTAMAFGPDGVLYVTVIGPEAKKGSVLKIAPGL